MADVVTPKGEAAARPPARFGRIAPRAWSASNWLQRRFGLVFVTLAVIVGVAVGGFVVLLGRHTHHHTAGPFSTWQPSQVGTFAYQQIAEKIGNQYKLANGQPLVAVDAKLPELQRIPISGVAIRSGPPGELPKDVKIYPIVNGAMFQLCGTGGQGTCTLPGTPSVARGFLVRREALELALYTFKFLPGVDSVLVWIPPSSNCSSSPLCRAVFFRRVDLQRQLSQPLTKTLPPEKKLVAGKLSANDQATIERLTRFHFFDLDRIQQLPDSTLLAVLTPPPLAS
jgi:hypothetical protein